MRLYTAVKVSQEEYEVFIGKTYPLATWLDIFNAHKLCMLAENDILWQLKNVYGIEFIRAPKVTEYVESLKAAAENLIDNAEEIIGDGSPYKYVIEIEIEENEIPKTKITKGKYIPLKRKKKISGEK